MAAGQLSPADSERARTWHIEIAQTLLPGTATRDEGSEQRFLHQGGLTIRKSDGAWYSHSAGKGGYWTIPLVRFLTDYTQDDATAWVAAWLREHQGTGSCNGIDDGEDSTPASAAEVWRILAEAVDIRDTPGAVYLESRRLDQPYPADIRYLVGARCGEGAVCALLYAHDRIVGCQIEYVDATGQRSLIAPRRRTFKTERSPGAFFSLPAQDDSALLRRLKAQMAAAHPDHGGSHNEFVAARTRYESARDAVKDGKGIGIGGSDDVVVAEGFSDALSIYCWGQRYCRIVGLPGIGVLRHQRFGKGVKVTVVADGDPEDSPARKSLQTGIDALLLQEAAVHCTAIPPDGWDANRFLVERGVDALQAFLASAAPAKLSDDGEIIRLSRLSKVDYDRARKQAADDLRIRLETLDDLVEAARKAAATEPADDDWADVGATRPWPDPVDGAELLDGLSDTIGKFVIMGDAERVACSLWTVFSYCIDASAVAPKLWVKSAERRSGKTRLLDVLALLVHRPFVAGYITPAALVRIIEARKPTVLLDEIDTFIQNNERLRGILDNGFDRGKPAVICTGDDNKPGEFDIFCPQVLAGIGEISDTVADRSVRIELERKPPSVKVARFRRRDTGPLVELSQKCARWSADNLPGLVAIIDDPAGIDVPTAIYNDRAADAWEILLAIADKAGSHWPERARRAAVKLSEIDDSDDESIGIALLHDIRSVFADTLKPGERAIDQVIASAELAQRLRNIEGAVWSEYGRAGLGLTQNQLARLLRPFHITPGKQPVGEKRLQGYARRQFESAFARYLKPLAPDDPPSPSSGNGADFADSTGQPDVTEDFCGFEADLQPDSNTPESSYNAAENPCISAIPSSCPVESPKNGGSAEKDSLTPDGTPPSFGNGPDFANSTGAPEQSEDFRGFEADSQPEHNTACSGLNNTENPIVSAVCSVAPVENAKNGGSAEKVVEETGVDGWINGAANDRQTVDDRIRELRRLNPKWSQHRIAQEVGCNDMRVSRALKAAR